jgi:hypothetical protein
MKLINKVSETATLIFISETPIVKFQKKEYENHTTIIVATAVVSAWFQSDFWTLEDYIKANYGGIYESRIQGFQAIGGGKLQVSYTFQLKK